MTRWLREVHGALARVDLELEAAEASSPSRVRAPALDLAGELEEELACFPPAQGEPAVRVLVRGGEPGGAPDGGDGWLGAHVTPEVWVRWRPTPAEAEVVVHAPAPVDEVVLATWARLVTAARFAPGRARAAFHAASFSGPAGGVLLLGDSGAGKTTLSRWLTHGPDAPCAYLGDEDALVELGPGEHPLLLPLPRRLRLLHPGVPRLSGREFHAFGESGWLASRPMTRAQPAPLTHVVRLEPAPVEGASLAPMPRDQLAYALLEGFERFPPSHAAAPGPREALRAANRQGFEATRVLAALPGLSLRYSQPAGFTAAAELLRELVAG